VTVTVTLATAYYDPSEIDRLLPPLPTPKRAVASVGPSAAITDDDLELIARLGRRSAVFGRLYAGDASDYFEADKGRPDYSDAEWGLAEDLLRATGGNRERTHRLMLESGLSGVRGDKWAEQRNGQDYLAYTIARAAESPSEDIHRAQEPGSATCPSCARYRRQIELINQLVRADLPAMYRLVLLYLVAVVGFYQSRGQQTFETRATQIARRLHVSAQSVRPVLHSLARYDNNELMREDGLLDLRVTRQGLRGDDACACPCHSGDAAPAFCAACRNQDAMISAFEVAPLTEGGYAGFLEAVVTYVPNLPDAPRRPARKKVAVVEPPPEVVAIPDCQGSGTDHYMQSSVVVCASCGDELLAATNYSSLNAKPQRSGSDASPWVSLGDNRHHSALVAAS
jgi:hypothetical protein